MTTSIRTLRNQNGVFSNRSFGRCNSTTFYDIGLVITGFTDSAVESSSRACKGSNGALDADKVLGIAATNVDTISASTAVKLWGRWRLLGRWLLRLTIRVTSYLTIRAFGLLLSWGFSGFLSTTSNNDVLVRALIGVLIIP